MALKPTEGVSSSHRWTYDVFLSFGGTDIRKTFVDHLYAALAQKGIFTFRNDPTLERGSISPELIKAIEESRIALVIFSKSYAFSRSCLDELVNILKCQKEMGQTVIPVFYHVDPSDVRRQKGSFAEAFVEHEERFQENLETVETWRSALTQVANLAGWHLHDG